MYHELTVWSRGIIMDKEARDVSFCIAAAARDLGYNAENVSDYIDDPDRMNCLVRRYARFGGQPIADRFVYLPPEMQAHDRFLDGYLAILEDNPMPARIYYRPCETACNRCAHDEPIAMRNVERYLGDYGLALPESPILGTLPPLSGHTVAIIGSGPAGLACAYHLRRLGHNSVIFEALSPSPDEHVRAAARARSLPLRMAGRAGDRSVKALDRPVRRGALHA